MKNITSEIVIKYHKYMAKTYEFQIIDKLNAPEMQIIAATIKKFIPIDSESFLKKYATTLYNRVYIPYKIGKGSKTELFRQIRIITHEAQHVVDFREDPYKMATYLALDSERAKIESRAMSTNLYLYWWYGKKFPNLTDIAYELYYYGLGTIDQNVVRTHLTIHTPIARRGQIPNNLVVKKGIIWLNRNCK